jgi:hypothetical protein
MTADEELKAAYKRGRAQATAYVAAKLGEKIEEGHPASIMFWLKTQGENWRETLRQVTRR